MPYSSLYLLQHTHVLRVVTRISRLFDIYIRIRGDRNIAMYTRIHDRSLSILWISIAISSGLAVAFGLSGHEARGTVDEVFGGAPARSSLGPLIIAHPICASVSHCHSPVCDEQRVATHRGWLKQKQTQTERQ